MLWSSYFIVTDLYGLECLFSDQPDSSAARPGSPNTSYPSNGYPPNRLDSTDVGVRRPRPHDVWVITPLFTPNKHDKVNTHGRLQASKGAFSPFSSFLWNENQTILTEIEPKTFKKDPLCSLYWKRAFIGGFTVSIFIVIVRDIFFCKGISLFHTWYIYFYLLLIYEHFGAVLELSNLKTLRQDGMFFTHTILTVILYYLCRFARASFLRINKRIIIFRYWTVGLVTGGQSHLLIGKVLSVRCLGFAHPMA